MRVGHDVLSIIPGGDPHAGDKDTWWWNDKVQEVIKAKKESMKMWETSVIVRLLRDMIVHFVIKAPKLAHL